MILQNKTEYDEMLPSEAFKYVVERQHQELGTAFCDKLEPNKQYIVEMRADTYEDPARCVKGYKAAIQFEQIVHCGECARRFVNKFCMGKPDDFFLC